MSTDYGYLCRDCNERHIIDNCRGYAVPTLQAWLDNFAVIEAAMGLPDLIFSSEHCGWGSVGDALKFAQKHRLQGHTVVVGDEYGREVDECSKQWRCTACTAAHYCTKKQGHEGACGR